MRKSGYVNDTFKNMCAKMKEQNQMCLTSVIHKTRIFYLKRGYCIKFEKMSQSYIGARFFMAS